MSNIVSLSQKPPLTEVNQEAVAELERLLQLAKDGQILGIMWVGLRPNQSADAGWTACPDSLTFATGLVGLHSKYGQAVWE